MQIIYGIVEAFHLDIVLAFILHIAQRDRVHHSHLSTQYFAICLVSVLSIGLVAMYLFMIYTVQRLTKEYNDLKVVEVSEMKKERYKFLLEDKAVKGNVFQRHYSLIGMLKDNYNCFVLYCFYNQPLVLVLMLLGLQLPMTVLVYFYPPFKVQCRRQEHIYRRQVLLHRLLSHRVSHLHHPHEHRLRTLLLAERALAEVEEEAPSDQQEGTV